jgi:uncharacterized LabA/DUF88 family protein
MWLDVELLSRNMLQEDSQRLVMTKYFTAPIRHDKNKQDRQNAYLDALRTKPIVQIILGRFERERKECEQCGHPGFAPQEKKTDVNIATNLISDALDDSFDTAIIVSADADLVPAFELVKKLKPKKRLIAAFPPNRYSKEVADTVHGKPPIKIWEPMLKHSRFPELITRDGLPDIVCPEKYRDVGKQR